MAHAIERITFLVHPYCYAESLRNTAQGQSPHWEEYHHHEVAVARRWDAVVDAMGGRDAVVYHPCYRSPEERALAARAGRILGDRFITLGARSRLYTAEIMAGIAEDVEEAFRVRGKYVWYAHDIRIAAFSCAYARDILSVFAERGLVLDPASTSLCAMGESFEGCANNWTTMLPQYLGIRARVEIPYELCVPDTQFVLGYRHVRRIERLFDTALHLFEGRGGEPLALFVRERVTLSDPSYYAALDTAWDRLDIRIRDGTTVFTGGAKRLDRLPPSFIRKGPQGKPEVMVASARWRGGEGESASGRESHLWLSADAVERDAFFAAAEAARIAPE